MQRSPGEQARRPVGGRSSFWNALCGCAVSVSREVANGTGLLPRKTVEFAERAVGVVNQHFAATKLDGLVAIVNEDAPWDSTAFFR